MIVRELIEELQKLDGSLHVVVPGAESSGFDDVKIGEPFVLALNVNEGPFCGRHEAFYEAKSVAGCDLVKAVSL